MICPYCQHDLDVASMACPRCGAEYPRPGKPFGMAIRTAIAAGVLLTASSMILTNCVLSRLPAGSGSPQAGLHPAVNAKSAEVNALLRKWAQQRQNTDMPLPQPVMTK